MDMLLDYARPAARMRRLGLCGLAALGSLFCAAAAIWTVVHYLHVQNVLQQASRTFCGNCYEAQTANLGLPIDRTIPLGFLSGGFALVLAIEAIRFANGSRR